MSTTSDLTSPENSAEPILAPQLSARFALRPVHVLIVAAWCVLFAMLNYFPLRSTDIWSHVLYGRWIVENGALPTEDPFMPLAEGMPVTDTAWLAQVLFYGVEQVGGPEALSALFALTVLATFLSYNATYYCQTRRPLVSTLVTAAVLAVGWSRIATIRPEIFAGLCFATLLWICVRSSSSQQAESLDGEDYVPRDRPWLLLVGVPAVLFLWANVHGSFFCGVALVGCFAVGHAVEVLWRERSLGKLFADGQFRAWVLAAELGLLATLINPYGVDLWLNTLWFASNDNLATVLEWQPMVIPDVGGWGFAASVAILLVVWRHSRRRIPVAHVLLLLVFAVAAVLRIRMLGWYAPVFGLVIAPHVAELVGRRWPRRLEERAEVASATAASDITSATDEEDGDGEETTPLPVGRSWKYSLVCLLLVWCAFALSPISSSVLGSKPRTPQQVYDSSTPLALTEYLRNNPPQGQVFNPQQWGDWIVWDGPPGIQPFVTSNIHLAPPNVWNDYLGMIQGQSNWQRSLSRYRIESAILDKSVPTPIISQFHRATDWRKVYEDDQAIVYKYIPIAARSKAKPPAPSKPSGKDATQSG